MGRAICKDNRFEIIDKAKKYIIENTNISSSEDEMKCLNSFLFRCWQLGWLSHFDRTIEFIYFFNLRECYSHVIKDYFKEKINVNNEFTFDKFDINFSYVVIYYKDKHNQQHFENLKIKDFLELANQKKYGLLQ